jgi:L-lactate dehydrogenase
VHGESQVAAWSTATIGGVPIDKLFPGNTLKHTELEDECKHRSQSIIRAKGATPLGIGSIVASICSSILLDKRNVRPVSHYQPEFGCCFSMPVILGRKGIIKSIHMPLSDTERSNVAESAQTLKETLDRIHED